MNCKILFARGLAGLAILIAVITAPVWAGVVVTGPLTAVSGASPFGPLSNCGNFPDGGQNFNNTEVEPWIDVNPTNPDNVVSIWQQDRWSNGGSRGNVAGVSFDGGSTWQVVPIPGQTDCTGGDFDRASDPWVSFGPDGALYQMSLLFDVPPKAERNAMAVSKSEDGGLTWSSPVLLIDNIDPPFFNDKNSLTADPTDANLVYAVWDRLESIGIFNFEGPVFFARSTDGGASFDPAVEIHNPGLNNQTLGNQIVVAPSGIVYNFFNEINNFRPNGQPNLNPDVLAFKMSLNQGATWLPIGRSRRIVRMFPAAVATPDTGNDVRDAAGLFDVAVDANSGALYAVFQDRRFTGFDQIALVTSSDGGRTWSTPIKVNQTPSTPGNPLRQQAFIPSVAVAGDGTVGVTYYDFRNDDATGELADYWLVHCHANCGIAASWADEVRLTETSFDYLRAAQANGLFLGDYMGLATHPFDSQFRANFKQTVPPPGSDRSDGFFREAGP